MCSVKYLEIGIRIFLVIVLAHLTPRDVESTVDDLSTVVVVKCAAVLVVECSVTFNWILVVSHYYYCCDAVKLVLSGGLRSDSWSLR